VHEDACANIHANASEVYCRVQTRKRKTSPLVICCVSAMRWPVVEYAMDLIHLPE